VVAAGIDEVHVGAPAYFFADVGGDDDILKEWIFAHKPWFKDGFSRFGPG